MLLTMMKRILDIQTKYLLWIFLFSPFVLLMLNNIYAYYAQFLQSSGFPRLSQPPVTKKSQLALLNALEGLQHISPEEKRQSLLFIPQSNRPYWQWLTPKSYFPVCKSMPFIAPAMTGIAMLDGLPSPGCHVIGYGFELYPPRDQMHPSLSGNAPLQICGKALSKGFAKVIVLNLDPDNKIAVHRITCSR